MSGSAPIAGLPMYDFPEIAAANDALWSRVAAGLRRRGVEVPAALARGRDLAALWRDPGLVFAQTCGYPYITALRDAVALIATPEYGFPGCDGPAYRSVLVCPVQDSRRDLAAFRGAVAAINALDSNSGMNLFRATIAPLAGGQAFFSAVAVTGSHAASLAAVADRRADLAAIDCVTFGLLHRLRPDLVGRVAVVAESPSCPGLPYVASARLAGSAIAAAREALFDALADPALAAARAALGLTGARVLTSEDYERVLDLERAAAAAGYPKLA
jgi:ABC-type phosphate/phosphonate transport system substrate-binding protein